MSSASVHNSSINLSKIVGAHCLNPATCGDNTDINNNNNFSDIAHSRSQDQVQDLRAVLLTIPVVPIISPDCLTHLCGAQPSDITYFKMSDLDMIVFLMNHAPDLAQGPSPRAQHLPLPWKFNGDEAQYPAWRAFLLVKMDLDGSCFGGEQGQKALILWSLSEQVLEFYGTDLSWMMKDPRVTPGRLLAYLDEFYQDSH